MTCRVISRVLFATAVLLSTSCVRSLPLTSHAHIGHSLTAWHDTPEKQGLFVIAEKEAKIALNEIKLARRSLDTPCVAKYHVENIVHALNPDIQKDGTGLGYGVVAAIRGTIQHLEFAADTKDTSENIAHSAAIFNQYARSTTDQFLLALAQARLTTGVIPSKISLHLPALEEALLQAVDGKDIDRDGVIGNLPEEAGLAQLRSMLSDMVANEVNPRYQPVGKPYLLGLVRMPDGSWVYKFNKNHNDDNG